MSTNFDPRANYELTKQQAGYVERKKATQEDYDRIGFMSGLEVHQQIKTKEKLFCHCPAGQFNKFEDYDAELIRHMRPTLSDLGEYDGTALMEFKTKKEIVYRINGKSSIKCVGENPRLNQAKSRYTKDIEGLLAQQEGIEGTSTFWMSDAYSPSDMAIEEAETVVCATQFEIQTDKSRGEIIWTGAYTLNEASVVTANVYLDDKLIYSCRDWRLSGYTTLTVSTPFEIQRGDEGVHEAKITLACRISEESDLTVMARQLAALENRVRQIEEGFGNEIAVETFVHGELTAMIGGISEQTVAATGTAGTCEIAESIRLELTAMLGGITENAEGETE